MKKVKIITALVAGIIFIVFIKIAVRFKAFFRLLFPKRVKSENTKAISVFKYPAPRAIDNRPMFYEFIPELPKGHKKKCKAKRYMTRLQRR